MRKIFQQYASLQAFLAGLSAIAYAYFFLVARDAGLSSLFLLLSGLFAIKVIAFLYSRLKDVDGGFALLGLIFGVVGAVGTMVHGGFDLANIVNPAKGLDPSIPSQIDPRGLLTFGSTGLALFYLSWLMKKDKLFPKNLSLLGFTSGLLLVWIYLARLTVLDPKNPLLLYPVLLEGFIVNPIWYIWLGSVLNKKGQ